MELPPYRIPTGKSIFRHTWEKGRQYLQKMSGVILVCSLAIWALGYFPRGNYETVQEQQENSYIGQVGKAIEPVLEPLGFDWRMGVGIVSGVGAKELVVSTLGVMYADDQPVTVAPESVGDSSLEAASESVAETRLQKALVKSVTPAGALAYMVFILLYFPCIATFIAIKQEGGGWKWAILTAVYTIILAWVAAFITFNIASLFI
jgi:ferrous iron transport protein B